jgi:cellulose biosynthesis protein BcsQ
MAKRIALFNHKGGVSQATTVFHLGRMLAHNDRRVILVDADPQGALTSMGLNVAGRTDLEAFYEKEPARNLYAALRPVFESNPVPLKAVDCVSLDEAGNLFLLPGHIRLSEYEGTLGSAQVLSPSQSTLANIPGSIAFLLDKTAEKFQADYLLIDLPAGMGSIHQNMLMTSDFFLVSLGPNYFSAVAIDSLTTILSKWYRWAKKAAAIPTIRESAYPFPEPTTKFLGIVLHNERTDNVSSPADVQKWSNKIPEHVKNELVPLLQQQDMLLSEEQYAAQGVGDFCLGTFAIEQEGAFDEVFSGLADKIIGLTSNAGSN